MGIAPDIGVRRAATLDRVGAVVFMYTWKTGRRAPCLRRKSLCQLIQQPTTKHFTDQKTTIGCFWYIPPFTQQGRKQPRRRLQVLFTQMRL